MIFFLKCLYRYHLLLLFLGFICIYIHFLFWVNSSYKKGFYWEAIEPMIQAEEKGDIFIEAKYIYQGLTVERDKMI